MPRCAWRFRLFLPLYSRVSGWRDASGWGSWVNRASALIGGRILVALLGWLPGDMLLVHVRMSVLAARYNG